MIRVEFISRPGRVLCFDLENKPLAYWYQGETTSEITAFGWKWHDEDEVQSMLLLRNGKFQASWKKSTLTDRAAYLLFRSVLIQADLVFGHNIRKHDLSIFQTGLIRRQLPILLPLKTSDTLHDFPKRNGMSRSLENLAAMYELGGEKYHMSQPAWEKANRLTPDGLELARKRVVSDVLLQEKLRAKLLELEILSPPRAWLPRRTA